MREAAVAPLPPSCAVVVAWRPRSWLRIGLLLITFAAALPAWPQADVPVPSLTRFRRFDTAHGLSQSTAWALVQDRAGFVWIGTQDGLNRFDGSEFRVYRHDGSPGSLSGNRISALALDHDGALWVGNEAGVDRYDVDRDRFEAVALADEAARQSEVRALHVDAAGRVWIGGYAGLSLYTPGQGRRRWRVDPGSAHYDLRIESIASDAAGRLWLGTLGGLLRLDPDSGRIDRPYQPLAGGAALATTRIDAILRGRNAVLWIAAVGAGLFRLDLDAAELRVYRHDPNDPESLNSDLIRSLLEGDGGRLWVGTREGLNLLLDPGAERPRFLRFAHYRHDPRSLASGRVMSLAQAQDGSLLIGTYTGGLSVLHPRGNRFTSFTPDSAATARLRDPVIYSLLPADDQTLWLGGRNGLYRFDSGRGWLEDFPQTQGLGISGLAEADGQLWLGVLAGAHRFDPNSGQLQRPPLPTPLPGSQITRFWFDRDRVFIGTYDRGLFVLNRADLSTVAHYPIASWVSQISLFDAERVLVCASDGLHWLSRDGGRQLHHHRAGSADAALGQAGITYFLRDRRDRLWLGGAGSGLLRVHLPAGAGPSAARFEAIRTLQPHRLDIIQALADDPAGHLWLSSARGIARYDADRDTVEVYGAADGAFDSDYSSAAVARLGEGRLAFAATRGFTVFDPARIGATPPPPAPLLTELRVWNRRTAPGDPRSPLPAPLHLLDTLTIPAESARMLSLRFAAVELTAPERLRYAYRLDGFDRNWIEVPASERQATYTNLAAGHYLFRVKAGEPGQLATAQETRLVLRILPPWWLTWWARLAFASAALLLLYLGYRWRVRSLQAQRQRLQAQVNERTAQLSQEKQRVEQALIELKQAQKELVEAEKMASLGQLVAGVSHEINTPLGVALTASSLLNDRSGAILQQFEAGALKRSELMQFMTMLREAGNMIERNLHRAAELVRSFKQVSVDRSTDERRVFDLGDYLATLLHSLQPTWSRRPIEVTLDCPAGLEMDSYPGTLAQVVSNFTQNALLHAFVDDRAGRIEISARALDGERIELRCRDDGQGIDADALAHVFEPFYTTRRGQGGTGLGLHIVYNLVSARLGGQIEVQSTRGQGTCFIVRMPRVAP